MVIISLCVSVYMCVCVCVCVCVYIYKSIKLHSLNTYIFFNCQLYLNKAE